MSKYEDYAIQSIILKSANRESLTDSGDDLYPTYELADDFGSALGDPNEAYFAKAIELITGAITITRKLSRGFEFENILYYPKSKQWMRNGFVDNRNAVIPQLNKLQ